MGFMLHVRTVSRLTASEQKKEMYNIYIYICAYIYLNMYICILCIYIYMKLN